MPKYSPPSRLRGKRIGQLHENCYQIYLHEPALDEILTFSAGELRREIGGFLIGAAGHGSLSHVEIRRFVAATAVESNAASLTFTHETWAAMRRLVDREYPGEVVVGWHHTHPGYGVFLSAYDLFIHRHFFSEPWQVALVVDPRQEEFGFFQWRDGQVVDCGFVCVKEGLQGRK